MLASLSLRVSVALRSPVVRGTILPRPARISRRVEGSGQRRAFGLLLSGREE
jgi:hypothetical protein